MQATVNSFKAHCKYMIPKMLGAQRDYFRLGSQEVLEVLESGGKRAELAAAHRIAILKAKKFKWNPFIQAGKYYLLPFTTAFEILDKEKELKCEQV